MPGWAIETAARAAALLHLSPAAVVQGALDRACFHEKRRQYDSRCIIERLRQDFAESIERGRAVLGITSEDLYVPGLNFVFGQAELGGACAIVSTHRLVDEAGALGQPTTMLERRLRTEVVHELGHVLGLEHCTNPYCAMCFSNSLLDTDRKGDRLCFACISRLGL